MEERTTQEKLYQDFLYQNFIVTAGHTALMRSMAIRLRRKMTPSERHLWQYLRANRLGGLQFRRQQIIGRFIADFYCDAARLAVELDGPVHDDQVEYDAERDRVIEGYGLCVLRFTNDALWADLNGVRRRILGEARRLIRCPFPSPRRGGWVVGARTPLLSGLLGLGRLGMRPPRLRQPA